jgi:hypothetical protein
MLRRALLLVGTVSLLLAVLMCTPAEVQVATAGTDGLDTVCKDLAAQPEPAYVAFGCDVVDAADNVVHTFAVKVPKAEAATLRATMVRRVHRVQQK